ncbi:TPA_asm: CaiF/GrlA family transcriptional regulator [Salmonella enterica subsp. houtenae serovar 45:g,z51:-]|uniref:CaiF/GrlA family transcriptional regulator n=1 Tax=Salmonella enterica subsp. houtenae serovar 45:g,z51:- TaxID=1967611 RepID=A0A736RLP2_SALHO|nr:CaiF/GrlA family transcriptional regulator [Salmonella enterica subsp. houtenae str. CFSAN000557]HAE7767578.1 CaiF/GrlA family transcriptional regulator [Salmonella enterica subsp. houtenae serovar 45:g,z51:-]
MNKKLTDNDVQKTIPASVSQYVRQPLYIIIALWCQQQNRWINRNDIAQAFSISVRRASFQLSYITRRQKKIVFRTRRQVISHHPCNEIWVKKVILEFPSGTTKKTHPPDNKPKPCNMGAYRSRVGNGMLPGENIWHKLVMIRKTGAKEEDS